MAQRTSRTPPSKEIPSPTAKKPLGLRAGPISEAALQSFLLQMAKNPGKHIFSIDGAPPTSGLSKESLARIGQASHILVSLPEKGTADDALLGIGAALAKDVPMVFVAKRRSAMPWLLREADHVRPDRIAIVERDQTSDLKAGIQKAAEQVAMTDSRPSEPKPLKTDTFLGSVMSGLNAEQYAAGRELLKAIDAHLRRQGSHENFSEALRIKDSSGYDTPADSLRLDLAALNGSKRATFFLFDAEPRPSSMWIEAGYALAKGIPSTFLVPHETDGLPASLVRSDLELRKTVYGAHDRLKDVLASQVT